MLHSYRATHNALCDSGHRLLSLSAHIYRQSHLRVIKLIDAPLIKIIDGMFARRRVLQVPVASFSCLFSLTKASTVPWLHGGLTSDQSTERPGQGDGKGPPRLGTEAASWRLPTARVGCRGCGSDGKSSGRSSRSQRTSDDHGAPTRAHATDNCRTIAPPIVARAGIQAGSGPAPS